VEPVVAPGEKITPMQVCLPTGVVTFFYQCCQLLAKDFGQINRKIRPLAEKFGRAHYPLKDAV
jgi:hypothetical protein